MSGGVAAGLGVAAGDDLSAKADAALNVKNKKHFAVEKDDDGNVYYGGLIQGADYQGFEPLDDYGQPNAGATEIHYINADGSWEQL